MNGRALVAGADKGGGAVPSCLPVSGALQIIRSADMAGVLDSLSETHNLRLLPRGSVSGGQVTPQQVQQRWSLGLSLQMLLGGSGRGRAEQAKCEKGERLLVSCALSTCDWPRAVALVPCASGPLHELPPLATTVCAACMPSADS